MKVLEVKEQIIELLERDLGEERFREFVDPNPKNLRDRAKFMLFGKPARTVRLYDGWFVQINLKWFESEYDLPIINDEVFYWYAFLIPGDRELQNNHYFICDYMQVIKWALDFNPPAGSNDHRDHPDWRAALVTYRPTRAEKFGYFRWGDEVVKVDESRKIQLDNIGNFLPEKISQQRPIDLRISETPKRMDINVSRIIRNTKVANELKSLYKNRCQICGKVVGTVENGYSEAHHVKPLGSPHDGADNKENILILCPNHHAEFDYGFIAINPETLKVVHVNPYDQFNDSSLRLEGGHQLEKENLVYHFRNIFKNFSLV